jgi:phosphonate transport system substrate-binding protein
MRVRISLLVALAVSASLLHALLSSLPVAADVPDVLRVSAIPDENPNELLRIYQPFADYLAREVGLKVQFTPVVDYAATVEGLAAKKLDLVWYGGFTFVQARRRTNNTAVPVVSRAEDLEFHSKFIASPGSGIKTLGDLKGKTFAFGSVSSTSGHLMPRYFLLRAGVAPDRDFKQVAFSGAHDATALWVQSGRVDAGALNEAVWKKLVEQKKVDLAKVDVFYTTPPYVDYVWTARGDLDEGVRERIASAFLKLDAANPEHKRLLDLHRASKYVRVKAEDFAAVEEAAVAAGLLK